DWIENSMSKPWTLFDQFGVGLDMRVPALLVRENFQPLFVLIALDYLLNEKSERTARHIRMLSAPNISRAAERRLEADIKVWQEKSDEFSIQSITDVANPKRRPQLKRILAAGEPLVLV